MAYDEALAAEIRARLADEPGVTEQKMFGGLGFMVRGNMAVAASGQGGILVRVDPADGDALIASTPAEAMVMRGKPMTGWLRVAAEHLHGDALRRWVDLGRTYAASLPPK